MRHATASFVVLALIAMLAACAGGRDGPRTPVGTDMGPRDGGGGPVDLGIRPDGFVPPVDLGGTPDLGRPDMGRVRMCITGCTTDTACQTSCPPNPTPTLPVCCDRTSGTCFNSSTMMCPAPTTTDGGTTMSL